MPESGLSCLFCKIVAGEIPSHMVHQDEHTIAIKDINPQAPVHFLVIPRQHVDDIVKARNAATLGKLFKTAVKIARGQSLKKGFRLVVNTGDEAGQTVNHLHVHVLGGRKLTWPPG